MARWFRFYEEALNDPKVQKLPPSLFKTWVNLLCLASRAGGPLGTLDEIAFGLRVGVKEASRAIDALMAAGLVDRHGDGIAPHNWHGRQYASDSSAERMRRHRMRKGDGDSDGEPPSQVTANHRHTDRHGDAADTDTDTDTEQIRGESVTASRVTPPAAAPSPDGSDPKQSKTKRGRRLDVTSLPDDWRAYCVKERPGLDPDKTFENFKDHFISSAGRNAAKLDWPAAWRLWVRREREQRQMDFGHGQAGKPSDLDNRRALADAFDEVAAEAEARARRVGT